MPRVDSETRCATPRTSSKLSALRRTAESHDSTGLGLSFSGGRYATLGGRSASEDTLSCFAANTTSSGPHMALKFGREMRTPAIQAGLTTRRLMLREIFPSTMLLSFRRKSSSDNRPSWSLSMKRGCLWRHSNN